MKIGIVQRKLHQLREKKKKMKKNKKSNAIFMLLNICDVVLVFSFAVFVINANQQRMSNMKQFLCHTNIFILLHRTKHRVMCISRERSGSLSIL